MAVVMERKTVKATISKTREIKHLETGSPFSMTRTRGAIAARPGDFAPPAAGASASASTSRGADFDADAFSPGRTTGRPTPSSFLRRGQGWGGKATTAVAEEVKRGSPKKSLKPPPKAGSTKPRYNPPNTRLRLMYERNDLPCIIDHEGLHKSLAWSVEIKDLEFSHYLPAFFDGLREEEEPYRFVASEGVTNMLEHGPPDKVRARSRRGAPAPCGLDGTP